MKKLLCLFLLLTVRLFAVNPVPFTEGLGYTFKIDGTGSSILTIYDEIGTNQVLATASGSTIESGLGTAWMIPGKSYTLAFWGMGPPDYTMSLIAPTGYSVYVNGVATSEVSYSPGTGWHLEYYTVELRPAIGESGGQWGQFSGIGIGKAISWGVGLGDLRTGRSAGGIQFKKPDLSGNPASRDQVYYAAPPANVGQVVVVHDGPSNQRLRQVCTPIGFTDLVDVTGGYEIRCYVWSQVASWTGTMYTFSGSPWKTIKVESPSVDHLKVTETQGAVVRVSQLGWAGTTSASGGTITTGGGYTMHTFNSSGTFTVNNGISSVDYLVVAGGGGGGGGGSQNGGGGGGGGGVLAGSMSVSSTSYTATVGAGGSGGTAGTGGYGGNSSFAGSVTAVGGGFGGAYSGAAGAGGSGGGAGRDTACCGGPNTSGQGFAGGIGGDWSGGSAGGGGGAGGAGNNGAPDGSARSGGTASDGGIGYASSISGTSAYYAGGGAGAWQITTTPSGGLGGGGYYPGAGTPGNNGVANTGGGGSGALYADGGAGGSGVVIIRYPGDPRVGTWTLQEGDGTTIARTTVHTSSLPSGGGRDDVAAIYNGNSTSSGNLVSKTKYHYVNPGWGEELDTITADPDTAALATSYTYYTNSANLGNYRRVQSVTKPTGGWTVYQYYDDWDRRGQLKYQIAPWLDTPTLATSASTTTGHVIYYLDYVADWTGRHTRPTARQEFITTSSGQVMVGQTTWSHGDVTGSGEPRATTTIKSYRDGSNYQSSYAESYRADADPDFAGDLYLAQSASQAQESVSISRGTFNTTTKAFTVGSTGDHWREMRFHGSTSSSGATAVTGFDSQTCPSVNMIPNKSTVDVTIRIAQGYVYRTETWVYNSTGGFSLLSSVDFDFDGYGNLTQRWASNGALTNYTYTNGRLTAQLDPDGTETQFNTFDPIGRPQHTVKIGASAGTYAAQADITTVNTYDACNHITQSVVSGGTTLSLTTQSYYDLAGRLYQTVAPGNYTTGVSYSSGGRVVTTTFPGGTTPITKVTEIYPDGHAKSVNGSAVVRQDMSYSVVSGGNIATQVNFGSTSYPTLSSALVTTTNDWLGREISEVKPAWGSGNATKTWTYDGTTGLLTKLSQPGLADTLYSYDTMGNLFRECLDVSGNGAIDLASSDRITEHGWAYFQDGSSNWWLRKATSTYAGTGSTATQLGKVETQLSGLPTNRFSITNTTDIYGNLTAQTVDVGRSSKLVTTTTTYPDSSTSAVQIAYNGLVVSSKDKANLTTTFGFDDLGRLSRSIDPRTATSGTGYTKTDYMTGTSQVYRITDPNSKPQAEYAYDSAGRVKSLKNALGKFAYYDYTTRNEKFREWGDTATPVEFSYDNWGHQKTMTTYRGGTGWTVNAWPGTTGNSSGTLGTADYTLWVFDEATGLLKEKYDAANVALVSSVVTPISGAKKVSYTYNQAGQIKTRTWARGSATTYYYFGEGSGEPVTGELRKVDYTDTAMTDLEYTYNRMGKIATVLDATGSRTFNYNVSGSGTLELQSEDLPSSFFNSRRITYGYDTASGTKGRPNALQLGTSGSPTADQNISYGYESATGRFNSLAAGGQTFAYAYATNSNLVWTITNTALTYTDTRTYDPNNDWTDQRETTWGSSPVSMAKFAYVQDDMGRITSVAKTSAATSALFNRYGNGTEGLTTYYGFDDYSQVKSDVTKVGTSTTVILPGRNDSDYSYDKMGNRSSVTHNGTTLSYAANALNQYTARDVANAYDVAGRAPGSSVSISDGTTTVTAARSGDYFFTAFVMANSSNPVFKTLTATDNSPTPLTSSFDAFVAKTQELFPAAGATPPGYDDDGNMLLDGRWNYTYDAENRLLTAETNAAAAGSPANVPRQKLTFLYDYLGRRVSKVVQTNWSSGSYGTTALSLRFIYNGWNLMAELDHLNSDAVVRSYCWGSDLSGSMQGAGGVGGLLMVQGSFKNSETAATDNSRTLLAVYDAMGNLHGLLTTASVTGSSGTTYAAGSFVAAYEYDAFGQTLRESGPYAASNVFRSSTKYTDLETGLVYYGLRYYSPSLGRFINKDPIEEKGGLNLYGFCSNNGVNRWDYLGMDPPRSWWETALVSISQAPIGPTGPTQSLNYVGGAPGAFLGNPYVSNGGATAFGAFSVALVVTGNIEFAPLAVYLGVQGTTQSAVGLANLYSYSTGTPASDLFPNTGLGGVFNGTANVVVGNSPNTNSFYYSSLDFTGNLALGGVPFVAPAYSATEPSFIAPLYADAIGLASVGQGALELLPDPPVSSPTSSNNPANAAPPSAPAPFVVPNLGAGSVNPLSGAFYRGRYNFGIPGGSTGSNNGYSGNVDFVLPKFTVTAKAPPGGNGQSRGGSGNHQRSSIPGATVITDPDEIAAMLSSLPSASDNTAAVLKRIGDENMK